MKKVLNVILSVFYLFVFILCLQSLGVVRNFGILWLVPAFLMVVFHIYFLFKKVLSFCFQIGVVICDIIFFASPFLIFGELILGSVLGTLIWIVLLICSIWLSVLIVLEHKKNKE